MNGRGRGPYRTLGAVVHACKRQNPYVEKAVDASTQFIEDRMQRFLDELRLLNVQTVSVRNVESELLRAREELYGYLGREVPRDGQQDAGAGGG